MIYLPRIQSVVAPILRGDPRLDGVTVVTWVPDVDFRDFPMLNVRRVGGIRNPNAPAMHSLPVIELTAYSTDGLIECEELYETALDVLYDAVKSGTQTPEGYLTSIFETFGATQFSSLYQDSWRIQGLMRLGVRRPRTNP
ncbi:tail terminator [Mycobacterium phage JewelBug]|uniref:Tail terminator n=1 Tax=Mycobacterium phage JewelBug TaxID=2502450 RepID=A0A411CGG0_9CAUD|nr:tail terminator [Mycobacterium phage JewelBug]QAY12916.1 tail terminator [Mycobacterium phage JewelBug]